MNHRSPKDANASCSPKDRDVVLESEIEVIASYLDPTSPSDTLSSSNVSGRLDEGEGAPDSGLEATRKTLGRFVAIVVVDAKSTAQSAMSCKVDYM